MSTSCLAPTFELDSPVYVPAGQPVVAPVRPRETRPQRVAGAVERAVAPTEPAVVEAQGNRSLAYRAVKRAIDIAGSLAALTVLAPVMAAVFLALLVTTCLVFWTGWRRQVSGAWILLGAVAVQVGITVAGFFQVYQTDDEVEILLYFVLGCALAVAGQAQADAGPEKPGFENIV